MDDFYLFVYLFTESEKNIFTCNHFTVAEGLRLTCNVTCDMKWKCTNECIWRTADGSEITCIDKNITVSKTSTYSCTVPKTVKHNGTFKFWVQMINGPKETIFNVTTGSFPLFLNMIYTSSIWLQCILLNFISFFSSSM